MKKTAKIIGFIAILAGAGYVAYLAPQFMRQLHEADQRDTAEATHHTPTPEVLPSNASNELTCGSDGAKALVVQVLRKNPPVTLITTANHNSQDVFFQPCDQKLNEVQDAEKKCIAAVDPPYASCIADPRPTSEDELNNHTCIKKQMACVSTFDAASQENQKCRADLSSTLLSKVEYSVRNIRLEERDQNTGAIECNVTLHVSFSGGPANFAADEEVSYKLEKMEDGGLHIEMAGLK